MQIFKTLLAETMDPIAKHHEQIADIHKLIDDVHHLSFKVMLGLVMAIAIVVVFVFLRQKKIAQNQVNLANMMQELIDKE